MKKAVRIVCGAILLLTVTATANAQSAPSTIVGQKTKTMADNGLKDAYKDYFTVGVAVNLFNVSVPEQMELIRKNFNSITAENVMKPVSVHPKEGVYNWGDADSVANFCRANNIKLRGHCLMWHTQFCEWMFYDKNGKEVSKEVFYKRVREHIHAVVNRYKDIVYCWDVVNEAIVDGPAKGWDGKLVNPYRESKQYKLCGEEFIAKAFEYAHEADPDAILFYNDYNTVDPAKRDRIYNMVKKMQQTGVPITGIGMQGHYNIYGPDMKDVEDAIVKYSELVKNIHITELDIRANNEMGGQLQFSRDKVDILPHIKTLQEHQYSELFRVFRKHKDVVKNVTFWNLSDKDSWLGSENHPLLFDVNLKPKQAYYMVKNFDPSKDCFVEEKRDSASRPKVGVVFSGGGAKGIAHIGVLKVLEKAGIPIDIVTGTSMGSLVGGLYSVGWNAEQLDSIVRTQDWEFLLSDRNVFSSQQLTDRKKQNTYFVSKTVTLTKKKSLSEIGGFIQGKNIEKLFNHLTAGYTDSMSFCQLPIPFACVGTNIIDNTEHVFHSGSLPQAMRTSMAIPGAFTPVRIGDKILVDGGLRNNYPADVAKEMGAQYIIGVTVQDKEKTADDLVSGTSVLRQIIDINCKNKYDDNLAITDIPIRVNTAPYGTMSFKTSAIDSLVAKGEAEAMKHWDEIMALKRKLGLADDYKAPLLKPKAEAMTPMNFTDTTQTGRPLQPTLTGSVGVRFDNEDMVVMQLNGLYRSAKRPFNLEGTVRLGNRIKLSAVAAWQMRHFLDMSLGYTFRHNDIDIYNKGDNDYNLTYNHHEAELSFLNIKLKNFDLDLSARFDYYHMPKMLTASGKTSMNIDESDTHFFSYHAKLSYNTENNWNFPRKGSRIKVEYAYYTNNFATYKDHVGFSELSAQWQQSIPLTKQLTFQPMFYGRMLYGKDIHPIRLNFIGGQWFDNYFEQQMPFVGIGHVELTDRYFAALQFCLQEQLTENNFVLLKIIGAQHTDHQRNLFDNGPKMGYQLAYYYRTMLGPVGASLSYSNHSDKLYFFINLGFIF